MNHLFVWIGTYTADILTFRWKRDSNGRVVPTAFKVDPEIRMLEYNLEYSTVDGTDPHWSDLETTLDNSKSSSGNASHWTGNAPIQKKGSHVF